MDTTVLNERLDRIEAELPAVPSNLLRLNRAVASQTADLASQMADLVCASNRAIATTIRDGVKTVSGQARAETRQVVEAVGDEVTIGAKTVAGQARAQARHVADTVSDELVEVTETMADEVEEIEAPWDRGDLADWTKAELYARAQELDVDGRSTMSKDQLVAALAAR